jgi:hypothetical protein
MFVYAHRYTEVSKCIKMERKNYHFVDLFASFHSVLDTRKCGLLVTSLHWCMQVFLNKEIQLRRLKSVAAVSVHFCIAEGHCLFESYKMLTPTVLKTVLYLKWLTFPVCMDREREQKVWVNMELKNSVCI